MAIDIHELKLPVSMQQVHMWLQQQTDAFGIYIDLDRTLEYMCILTEKQHVLIHSLRGMSGTNLNVSDKASVVSTLIKMGVPPHVFGDNSLNKGVIQSIIDGNYSEDAVIFAKGYSLYASHKNRLGTLRSYSQLPQTELYTKNNHRLVKATPVWHILNTSRHATSDPNIQAIAKDFCDLVAEPEGYHLIRCDSNQIEPRITWSYFTRDDLIIKLITLYKDAYLGIMAFCEMTPEEERIYRSDFSKYHPMEVNSEVTKRRKELKTFTLAATYGSTKLSSLNSKLASAYEEKIIHHPMRMQLEAKVKDQVNRGDLTFYGAFGTPVNPEENTSKVPGSPGWIGHVVRCGINNPVQTTASELMAFSVAKAMSLLSELEDSHIAFYKHDEACFYISDKDMERKDIINELADITAYNVDGWIPITCEVEYGVLHSNIPTDL